MNYIIFFDDTIKEIDEKTKEEIISEMSEGAIGKEMQGSFYKFSDIRKILTEQEYKEQYPDKIKNYGQPYSDIQAIGFKGIITNAKRLSAIESLAKGLKKAKEKFNCPTPGIDSLLDLARKRYAILKKGQEPVDKFNI